MAPTPTMTAFASKNKDQMNDEREIQGLIILLVQQKGGNIERLEPLYHGQDAKYKHGISGRPKPSCAPMYVYHFVIFDDDENGWQIKKEKMEDTVKI